MAVAGQSKTKLAPERAQEILNTEPAPGQSYFLIMSPPQSYG